MQLTKKLLEDRIINVREQGAQAANIVQQAIGAELMLQELVREMELLEAIAAAEADEAAAVGLEEATDEVDDMNGLSE